MKKSLIALAALAATGIASAQSSVTLFGIVDATMQYGTTNATGGAHRWQLGNSGYSSSQFGVRGTEDLGGGLRASFWLEAGVNNDNGTGAATNTNNQVSGGGATCSTTPALPAGTTCAVAPNGTGGLTFNRRSTLSLEGSWGELRLGRHFNPTFWNLAVFDPFGFNGVGTTRAGANSVAMYGVAGVRASNKIEYFAPANLGGFYGNIAYWLGENASNVATKNDGTGWGLRAGYGAGPFNLAAAYSRTKYVAGDSKTWNLGGQWDFGMGRLMGHYTRDKSGAIGGKGWLLGGLVPVGAGEIRASYSRYRVDGGGARQAQIALGYVHNLSKRTAVYATYATLRNSNGGAVVLNGGIGAGTNFRASGLDLGVRHSF